MRDIGLDIRYAFRALRGSPTSTISALLTLTLGIAMSTSIFSVVSGVVLQPLPFSNENRLISICEQYPGATPGSCRISPPTVEDIAAGSQTLEAVGIGREWPYTIQTPTGADEIAGGLATPGMFQSLGVHVEQGRMIEASDLIGTESTVGLITHEAWQARFGGRRDIVGHVVELDGKSVTIVGVIAPGFVAPGMNKVDLWRPLHVNPRDEANREWRGFSGFGLRKRGVSLEQSRADLAGIARRVAAAHFATTPSWGLSMTTTRELIVGSARPMLYVFLGAVLVVLLIGCANIANLLLARANARTREVAVRAALGASPSRIARGLFIESMMLSLVGGAFAVVLAVGATKAFKAFAPAGIPRVADVSIDGRVLAFALLLTIGTTLVFGLLPALRGARVDLARAIGEGGRGSSASRGRLGSALVVGELALAVVLVASAGLLVRSFSVLTSWKPGFEQEHLLTFSVFAPTTKYPSGAPVASLWQRLEHELATVPGVTTVATASAGPLFGARETWELDVQQPAAVERASVRWMDASPDYFATLGVPIVRGRPLNEGDVENGPLVGVVNETLARRFWPSADPIGKTLTFAKGNDRAVFRIVGVSRDVPPLNPGTAIEPQLVWSNRQIPRGFTYFIARSTLDPASVSALLSTRVKQFDRDLEARDVRTLPDLMRNELVTPRFTMLLVASFGVAALFFAGIGTFGLLSYLVSQRTREIGIRYALGAGRRDIIATVVCRGLVFAGLGVGIGIAATLSAGGAMRSLIVGVSVTDMPTLVGASAILIGVAVSACLVPALRASRVNPVIALASE